MQEINTDMELVQKGLEIIETNRFSFNEKWDVDFAKLDWKAIEFDANNINPTYLWYLHQMHYINALIEYDRYYQNKLAISYIFKFLNTWWETFKNDTANKYAWHDHATAIRAVNLKNLYVYLQDNIKDTELSAFVKIILSLHKEMLLKESFYSRLTNHGLDQSLALYRISHILGDKSAKHIAVVRVNNEISHAFCEDGGHIENSPAYLCYGLHQALEAFKVGQKIDGKDSDIKLPDKILSKAILFLAFVVQPNGKLPLIGDTKDYKVTDKFSQFAHCMEYQNFLYSIRQGKRGEKPSNNDLILTESGWVIFRESWEQNRLSRSLHLVFKCGFLSNYHRQDDDLNCTLFYDDEEWLIDGGEYCFIPKDPYRIYFRSKDSHNLSSPCRVAVCRDKEEIKKYGKSEILGYSKKGNISKISGNSYIFTGFKNTREICYDRDTNFLSFHDKCTPLTQEASQEISNRLSGGYAYVTRFHIPNDKTISVNRIENIVSINGKRKKMILSAPDFKGTIKVTRARNKPVLGYISRKSNVLEEAWSIEFFHKTPILNQVFEMRFTNEIKIDIKTHFVGDTLQASLEPIPDAPNFYYCFVLMQDGQKVETRWYQKNNKVEFATKINKDSEYSILGYVRDENKEICARKMQTFCNVTEIKEKKRVPMTLSLKNFKQLLINEYGNKENLRKIKKLSTSQSFKERIFSAGELGDKEFYIKKTFAKSKFCYTLFESKSLSFWSVSAAVPYFTVIPAEKLILIWREEFKKEIPLINFNMKSEISNDLDSSKPLMIYLSYGRPGHFFEHMNYYYAFFGKDKIQPDIAIVMNETYFDFSILEKMRGINVLKFENDDALNQYCITHKRGVQKIMRVEIRDCLLKADDWYKKYNGVPHPEFYRIPEDAFVLWINICHEKRVWKEKEETIIKLIQEFSNLKNNLCVILDGMTRASYITREQFLLNSKSAQIDDEFVEKIKSLFSDTEIQFINSVGFSSGEKMYLADRVQFFITGYWTDSLYVAKFARAFGVAFGSKAAFKGSFVCFHPNTMMMPNEYVTDIGSPGQNYSTIGYSINSDDFIDFVKKTLVNFESISERKIVFDGKGFIHNYNNAKRFYSLKSSMKHKSSYLTIAEKFAPFSINTDTSYNIESNIEYYFTANGFSKNNSIVLIIAYDDTKKRIFVEKLKFLETKSIIFPKEATTFRIFIKLMPQDEIKFYGIRWVTQNESSDPWFSIRHKTLVRSTNKLSPNISAISRIHSHLAYKLGQAMILNSKSLLGYIRMPYVLSYIKELHKREQQNYQEKIKKNPKLKLPKLESYPDYKEALKEKQCFTYKLGEALMQADEDWYKGGYLRFCFKEVPRLRKELKEKNLIQKRRTNEK